MGPDTRVVSRDRLYEEVWERPATKVAADYGVTGTALAKICAKYEIPRPSRGDWAKLRHGKPVRRKLLPSRPDLDGREILIRASPYSMAGVEPTHVATPVRRRLRHPLVLLARSKLEGGSADRYGTVLPPDDGIHVRVAPKTLLRALRIMDVLFEKIEEVGGSVRTEGGETILIVDGEKVPITFEELRTIRTVTKRSRFSGSTYQDRDYVPTGRLQIEVQAYVRGRRRWRDTDKRRLEDVLGHFLATLPKIAEQVRDHRLEREAWQREYEEQRRRAQEFEQNRKRLDEALAAWERSGRVREFVVAARRAVEATPGRFDAGFQEWLDWVERYADSMDPLTGERPAKKE